MFGWLKRASPKVQPEAKWTIATDDDSVRIIDEDGATRSVAKDALSAVIIETNDSGPWRADVWWLLFGADDRVACIFPQGSTGETALIDYLSALPGFDHGQLIGAMGSTDNAVFPVWRRAD